MPSVIDIANQALSHLGDSATVASIDPPEGSAQAEHCARFYPLALAAMLEMHNWSFATRRITLAPVANPSSTWQYCYALPNNAISLLAVLAIDAIDDYSGLDYTPQQFVVETDALGSDILLTNQSTAVLRYTVLVTDPTKFSPLFVEALGWLLASKLAGPVLKGETGMSAAQACTKTFVYWMGKAIDSDSSDRKVIPTHQVGWMNAR